MLKIFSKLMLVILLSAFVFPVVFVIIKSLREKQYYELVINTSSYFKYGLKSIVLSGFSGFLSVMLALPVGYIFAKIRFKFRNTLFFVYILIMLLPFQATQLSGYILFKKLNLIDSPWTLVICMVFSPLSVFLIRQCLVSLPDDVSDAFSLESKSVFRFLWHIVLPFAMPMLITSFLLIFCASYSLVEQAYVYMPKNIGEYPLSAVLSQLPEQSYFAGCTMFIIPVLAVYLNLEKTILKGMEYYRWD